METEKLLVIAQELSAMVNDLRAKQVGTANKEVLLSQALYGVQFSMDHILAQLESAIKIETLNGNTG